MHPNHKRENIATIYEASLPVPIHIEVKRHTYIKNHHRHHNWYMNKTLVMQPIANSHQNKGCKGNKYNAVTHGVSHIRIYRPWDNTFTIAFNQAQTATIFMYKYLLFVLPVLLSPFSTTMAAAESESHAVIFMYHRFGEDNIPATNIRLEQFETQLNWLAKNNFNVWPLSKIINHLKSRAPIPDKTVAITMDDAYRSVFTEALPRLKQRGWPFTVFVSTNYIDNKYSNYMSWDQMRSLQKEKVEFANHSTAHSHLIKRLAGETKSMWINRITRDIEHAQNRLEEELGTAQKFIAYPYGEYTSSIKNIINKLGFIGFGQQSGAIGSLSDFSALPRYPISEAYGELAGFAEKALSLPMPLKSNPSTGVIIENNLIPKLSLTLINKAIKLRSINCFATGEGRINIDTDKQTNSINIQARKQSRLRRSRYNCTAPSGEGGRYYWHSQLWINPLIDEKDE